MSWFAKIGTKPKRFEVSLEPIELRLKGVQNRPVTIEWERKDKKVATKEVSGESHVYDFSASAIEPLNMPFTLYASGSNKKDPSKGKFLPKESKIVLMHRSKLGQEMKLGVIDFNISEHLSPSLPSRQVHTIDLDLPLNKCKQDPRATLRVRLHARGVDYDEGGDEKSPPSAATSPTKQPKQQQIQTAAQKKAAAAMGLTPPQAKPAAAPQGPADDDDDEDEDDVRQPAVGTPRRAMNGNGRNAAAAVRTQHDDGDDDEDDAATTMAMGDFLGTSSKGKDKGKPRTTPATTATTSTSRHAARDAKDEEEEEEEVDESEDEKIEVTSRPVHKPKHAKSVSFQRDPVTAAVPAAAPGHVHKVYEEEGEEEQEQTAERGEDEGEEEEEDEYDAEAEEEYRRRKEAKRLRKEARARKRDEKRRRREQRMREMEEMDEEGEDEEEVEEETQPHDEAVVGDPLSAASTTAIPSTIAPPSASPALPLPQLASTSPTSSDHLSPIPILTHTHTDATNEIIASQRASLPTASVPAPISSSSTTIATVPARQWDGSDEFDPNWTTFSGTIPFILSLQDELDDPPPILDPQLTYSAMDGPVPLILHKLLKALNKMGATETEGIFRRMPKTKDLEAVRARLESGVYKLKTDDPLVPAAALKEWLASIAIPILPPYTYPTLIRLGQMKQDGDEEDDNDADDGTDEQAEDSAVSVLLQQLFASLPLCHRRVLCALTHFLHKLLTPSSRRHTGLSLHSLGVIFGDVLTRLPAFHQQLQLLASSQGLSTRSQEELLQERQWVNKAIECMIKYKHVLEEHDFPEVHYISLRTQHLPPAGSPLARAIVEAAAAAQAAQSQTQTQPQPQAQSSKSISSTAPHPSANDYSDILGPDGSAHPIDSAAVSAALHSQTSASLSKDAGGYDNESSVSPPTKAASAPSTAQDNKDPALAFALKQGLDREHDHDHDHADDDDDAKKQTIAAQQQPAEDEFGEEEELDEEEAERIRRERKRLKKERKREKKLRKEKRRQDVEEEEYADEEEEVQTSASVEPETKTENGVLSHNAATSAASIVAAAAVSESMPEPEDPFAGLPLTPTTSTKPIAPLGADDTHAGANVDIDAPAVITSANETDQPPTATQPIPADAAPLHQDEPHQEHKLESFSAGIAEEEEERERKKRSMPPEQTSPTPEAQYIANALPKEQGVTAAEDPSAEIEMDEEEEQRREERRRSRKQRKQHATPVADAPSPSFSMPAASAPDAQPSEPPTSPTPIPVHLHSTTSASSAVAPSPSPGQPSADPLVELLGGASTNTLANVDLENISTSPVDVLADALASASSTSSAATTAANTPRAVSSPRASIANTTSLPTSNPIPTSIVSSPPQGPQPNSQLLSQLAQLQSELDGVRVQLSQAKGELVEVRMERDEARDEARRMEKERDEAREAANDAEAAAIDTRAQAASSLPTSPSAPISGSATKGDPTAKIAKLKSKLRMARAENDELFERCEKLETELETMKNSSEDTRVARLQQSNTRLEEEVSSLRAQLAALSTITPISSPTRRLQPQSSSGGDQSPRADEMDVSNVDQSTLSPSPSMDGMASASSVGSVTPLGNLSRRSSTARQRSLGSSLSTMSSLLATRERQLRAAQSKLDQARIDVRMANDARDAAVEKERQATESLADMKQQRDEIERTLSDQLSNATSALRQAREELVELQSRHAEEERDQRETEQLFQSQLETVTDSEQQLRTELAAAQQALEAKKKQVRDLLTAQEKRLLTSAAGAAPSSASRRRIIYDESSDESDDDSTAASRSAKRRAAASTTSPLAPSSAASSPTSSCSSPAADVASLRSLLSQKESLLNESTQSESSVRRRLEQLENQLESERERFETLMTKTSNKLENYKMKATNAKREVIQLRESLELAQARMETRREEEKNAATTDEHGTVEDDSIDSLRSQVSALQFSLADAREKAEHASDLESENRRLRAELIQLSLAFANKSSKTADERQEEDEDVESAQRQSQTVQDAKDVHKECEAKHHAFQSEIDDLQQQVTTLQHHLKARQELHELELSQQTQSHERRIDALTKSKLSQAAQLQVLADECSMLRNRERQWKKLEEMLEKRLQDAAIAANNGTTPSSSSRRKLDRRELSLIDALGESQRRVTFLELSLRSSDESLIHTHEALTDAIETVEAEMEGLETENEALKEVYQELKQALKLAAQTEVEQGTKPVEPSESTMNGVNDVSNNDSAASPSRLSLSLPPATSFQLDWSRYADVRFKLSAAEARVADLSSQLEHAQSRSETRTAELTECKRALNDAQDEVRHLNDELATLKTLADTNLEAHQAAKSPSKK